MILRGHDSNSSASPPGDVAGDDGRAAHGALGAPAGRHMHGAPGGIQPQRARHPDPQHRADDLIDQGIRLHGILTWRTDRQEFELRTKQIKALAFKRVE